MFRQTIALVLAGAWQVASLPQGQSPSIPPSPTGADCTYVIRSL